MRFRFPIFLGFVTGLFLWSSSFAALASPFRLTSSYTQRKVSSGKFPIHSACMMPPQGHLTRIGVKGAEGMSNESEAWAGALEALVESHLKADGIAIGSATEPLSSGASNDEIRGVISQVQEKLGAVAPLMLKKPGQISKSAYTLGDQVGMLPCSENSDILVFVQGVGQVVTDGRAALSFAIGGPTEDAVVLVTMADAKSGEIIGLIRMYPGDEFLDSAEKAFGTRLDNELWIMNVGSARKHPRPQENEY